ncbi:c-type cytochrome [Hydrogenivirga sp. 128-5-R1-1]|uniref:c-type cytochrome n=1 Tax=Hydrogenivirga sp. 128-5-R1-1 TaxID=392423 RepID=UPI00015F04FF|nr:c-type cytochrome [Hydrogenivirga sp. 128-5-R1-1]EDP73301.1 ubiquinol cytochrome c oxidoreductase, cytochrome c1 [Hydrogenivirga sp. 128-5-R1-1]
MKELKILFIIAVIVLIGYYGIEPFAHHEMYGGIPKPDFNYLDLKYDINIKGNPKNGENIFKQNCQSCHSLKAKNLKAMMDKNTAMQAFNVIPPDLSNMAAIVEKHFLFNFIKNPQNATKNPKFAMPPMSQLSDQQIADIIAFLETTANKNITGEKILEDACTRCHSVKYQKIKAFTHAENLKKYLGKVPPDLSLKGRSKTKEYLEAFINNPQAVLPGTSMPRLGLKKESAEKVIAYLQEISDPHKKQRDKLGLWILGYVLIGVFLTYAWKKKVWAKIK